MAKSGQQKPKTKAAKSPLKRTESKPAVRSLGPFEDIEHFMETWVPRAWFPQLRREEKKEEGEYFRSEITHGEFSRTVALPADVEASKAQATFENGMLKLQLPKKQRTKRIKVEVG